MFDPIASTVIGGGISAIIGTIVGVIIHSWVDKVKKRKKAVELLRLELSHNRKVLNGILRDVLRGKTEIYRPPFQFWAYNFIIVEDPELVNYIDKSTRGAFTDVYASLKLLDDVRLSTIFGFKIVRQPLPLITVVSIGILLRKLDEVDKFLSSIRVGFLGKIIIKSRVSS